jgi:hypothetical protein
MGFRAVLCGFLFALVGCGSAEDGGADAAQADEQDLDALDIANSWTDAANPKDPDVAGPLWWASMMKLRGPKVSLRAVLPGRPREPVGVFANRGFAETGAFTLAPGDYGVLVQYKENVALDDGSELGDVRMLGYSNASPTSDKTLGHLVVSTKNPVGAGGWRRAYFAFTLAAASDVQRIHVESTAGGAEWQIGLVAVHREGRPFYGIAHNPDSVARLDQAIAAGANALEPDLRQSSDSPQITTADDGLVAVTEEGITGGAVATNGQATLTSYLRELNAIAPKKLVIWDTKPGATKDYAAVATAVQKVGRREGFDFSKSVFNISNASMAPLFQPFAGEPVGRCFDGIFTQVHSHTAAEWMTPVRQNRLTFQGLGVTPQLQVTEKWSVPISVYVRAREQEEFPKKIYFWTVNDASAMRRVLDLGIDGLITDEIPLLRSILREEPYASMYRYASDDDDHAVKHGGSWYHVESSASLDR